MMPVIRGQGEAMQPLTHEQFASAIHTVRERYIAQGETLWSIGNGLCENFAYDVLQIVVGDDWMLLEGTDGRRWQTLDTDNLITPQSGDWDWDLLAASYGTTVEQSSRAALNYIAALGPAHIWIWFDGRHYDCEHPSGVSSHFDLCFFKRYLDLLNPACVSA
jgi:hypothetical protein